MGGIAGLFENMRQNTQVNFSLQMKGYQLIVSRDWQIPTLKPRRTSKALSSPSSIVCTKKSKTSRRNCHPEL
jgi:hypothetical protein